jgi:hypothetical protein
MPDVEIKPSPADQGDEWRDEIPMNISMKIPFRAHGDEASARDVFLAWEVLRFYYNGILALLSLILFLPYLNLPSTWGLFLVGAVAANLCFSVGSCAEGYMAWLGIKRAVARPIIFVAGTLLSAALVALTKMSAPWDF